MNKNRTNFIFVCFVVFVMTAFPLSLAAQNETGTSDETEEKTKDDSPEKKVPSPKKKASDRKWSPFGEWASLGKWSPLGMESPEEEEVTSAKEARVRKRSLLRKENQVEKPPPGSEENSEKEVRSGREERGGREERPERGERAEEEQAVEEPPVPTTPYVLTPYEKTLDLYVDHQGGVDYLRIKSARSMLDKYIDGLAGLKLRQYQGWNKWEQIAFWLNAYNGCVLQVVIDNYPIKPGSEKNREFPYDSIQQIPGVWKERQWCILGEDYSLTDIEEKIATIASGKPVLFGMSKAALGAVPLGRKPYEGGRLDRQLDLQAHNFIQSSDHVWIDRECKVVHVTQYLRDHSKLLNFNGEDRALKEEELLAFIAKYRDDLAESDARAFSPAFFDMDWSLNRK